MDSRVTKVLLTWATEINCAHLAYQTVKVSFRGKCLIHMLAKGYRADRYFAKDNCRRERRHHLLMQPSDRCHAFKVSR